MKKLLALLVCSMIAVAMTGCSSNPTLEDGTLTVGLECGYAPFNWTQPNSGEYTAPIDGSGFLGLGQEFCGGYDIRVAKTLAEDLGYKLRIKKLDWDGLQPSLDAKNIDVIIAGMTPTPDREKEISFSDPYYKSNQVIIVKENSSFANATTIAAFKNQKLVAQQGTMQDDLIEEFKAQGVIHGSPYPTYPAALMALSADSSIAGVVTEKPVAESYAAANPGLKIIKVSDLTDSIVDQHFVLVSVGLRKSDTELKEKINVSLAKISDETRDAWMLQAMKDSE